MGRSEAAKKCVSLRHAFTHKKNWVKVLDMGFIPTPKTHTQNPIFLGMKPNPKLFSFFELLYRYLMFFLFKYFIFR